MQVSFIGYCLQSKFEASAIVTAVSPGQKMQHVNSSATGRICVFFAIAYLSQGISCAQFGVIAQPIQFFLMKGLDLSAAQVSSYMALMMLPWVIKPFYGLISDFVPFLGYRRKSYLVLSNVITSVAFATMIFSQSLFLILAALMITAIGMAMATALMLGVAVEAGRVNGKVRTFLTIQEVCYYGSNILAGILGGYLCHTLVPVKALHIAALVAVFPVLIMSLLSATLLDEKRSDINAEGLKETVTSLRAAVVSPALWLVAAFSFGWSFMPVFGVPLYFHESKTLGFSQTVIGQLAAWNSAGMLLGALLYPRCIKVLSQKMQLFLTTAMCSLSVISYLLLSTPESAVLLEVFRGVSNVIAILLIYSLAADVCPRRIEVSVMALLVAIRNIATNLSTFTGGQLFTYVFAGQFPSLVLVSVLAPLLCALIVPLVCKYREIEMSARSLAENS